MNEYVFTYLKIGNIWRNTHFSIVENCNSLRFFLWLWIPRTAWFNHTTKSIKCKNLSDSYNIHLFYFCSRKTRIEERDRDLRGIWIRIRIIRSRWKTKFQVASFFLHLHVVRRRIYDNIVSGLRYIYIYIYMLFCEKR